MTAKPKEITTKTIVIVALLYSLATNLHDVAKGCVDGWNAAAHSTQVSITQ